MAADELAALEGRRLRECRLEPAHALRDLEEAQAWVLERGIVTLALTRVEGLPSIFVACHEEPYEAGKAGFARWPKTRWWWPGELAGRPGIVELKILRGRSALIAEPVARLVDPLARQALLEAEAGVHAETPRRLVEHLAAAGPTFVEELREELELSAGELRRARVPLERTAAVVARSLTVPTEGGGQRHTVELLRWDQLFPTPSGGGIKALTVAAVRSAVFAPERLAGRWFSWTADIDALVASGQLARVGGYVAIPASGS